MELLSCTLISRIVILEVTIQDRPNFEQVNLVNQLDDLKDHTVVFKIIDTMLTKKKFKDFSTTTSQRCN